MCVLMKRFIQILSKLNYIINRYNLLGIQFAWSVKIWGYINSSNAKKNICN